MQARSNPKWLRRIAWLAGLWAASILALSGVAFVIRIFMNWAGLTV